MAVTPQGQAGEARLKKYWLTEGLSKWATKPHPWTSLKRALMQKMIESGTDPGRAEIMSKGMATELYHAHFGDYPGSDTARVRKGKPPRGERIGPG
ncbi:MAG: hypothetical protein WC977_12845 [Anaerovoracaceae bacterium]|jgi:hypothetical protein